MTFFEYINLHNARVLHSTRHAGKMSILKKKKKTIEERKKRSKFTDASARGNFTREARITWSHSREKIPTGTRVRKKKGRGRKIKRERATAALYAGGAHKARVKNARPRRIRPACRCENRTRAPAQRGACVRA